MGTDLQRRLALSLFGLSVLTSALVGGVLWMGHAWMEKSVLAAVLEREGAALLQQPAAPGQLITSAQGVSLYRPDPNNPEVIPDAFRRLSLGSHRDVHVADREYHVVVGKQDGGPHYYLAYDVTAFAHLEAWLGVVMGLAIGLAALLSWVIGRSTAKRLLAPVESVVRRIGDIDRECLKPVARQPQDRDLGVVIDAVNGLVAEIEQRVQRERTFAAAAGHELRTPLTAMRIAADTLAPATPEDAERVRRIQRGIATSSATLDTLLQAARGIEPVTLEDLQLDTALPLWAEPYLQNSATQLDWQLAPVRTRLPATAFATIFTNLLRNALKASPDGRVVITLAPGRLTIADDGEGIDADLLAHAFEPGTSGRAGGSGIGLYISRLLAERNGWTLSLQNRATGGAIAELRFPG